MKIAIIASGSRGDVQPYIALGKGLQNAGHEIRFVTHQNFASLVTQHDLEFWPIAGNVQDVAQSADMLERLEKGNFLAILSKMAKEAERGAVGLAEGGLAACQGVDMLLTGMGGIYIGMAIAEKVKLPLLQAYVVPFTPTRAFPGALTPNLPPFLNHFSHQVLRQMMWQGLRPADRVARREVLDLPAAPFWGPYNSERTLGLPILYGFSPAVIPPPPDWGDDIHVTGYWFIDSGDEWSPPLDLMDFLESGPPPLYIGFGSMGNSDPKETTDLVLNALERTEQRAILLSGWGGLEKIDLPDSVFMIDSVPHDWLFPRMAAVVHHGGASTTAAGLRAGIPSVVIPFFGDQPFWGQRIADLGVGPAPIPRKRLTVERLEGVIQKTVTDEAMRQHAAELGLKIRAEDGVARAVQIIGRVESSFLFQV